MYEGQSFSRKYTDYCEQRKRRRSRTRRLVFGVFLAVCVAALALVLSDRLLPIEVWATPEKDSKEIQEIDFGAIQPEESEPEEEPEPEQKNTPVIFIDAGHGGNDGGWVEDGIIEKEINLAIARLVRDKLKELGYQVVMSRSVDRYVAKEDRVRKANEIQADIYVSIHQNSSDERSVNGMEVWYDGTDAQRDSRRLALLVSQQTAGSTGAAERMVRGDADFHVTGSTQMPACLIETGFLTNREERTKLAAAEYQEKIATGIVQGIEYYFHPKTMYLTFDDGPSEENTERVLDILKKRNIQATFFLVGENVERHPEIVRRIVREGHSIGIHCYKHDYKTLYQSTEKYVEDFEHARRVVYEVCGVEAQMFRFPGGSINNYNRQVYTDIIKEMTARGYIYYDWNASLEDAAVSVEPQMLLENGVETTKGREKVILLAHDVVYDTGTILEDLLDRFPEYEMRPLSEEVEPIQF